MIFEIVAVVVIIALAMILKKGHANKTKKDPVVVPPVVADPIDSTVEVVAKVPRKRTATSTRTGINGDSNPTNIQ